MAITLTEANFDKLVLQATGLVLVDFRADWCAGCKMLDPVIEALYETYGGKAIIGKIDVGSNPTIVRRYSLQHVPALIFFKDGKVVDRFTGALPQNLLTEKLDKQLI